jgi:hypothetical protein
MVYRNTRIATGGWTGKGVESDGSKVDSHELWSDGMGEDAGWQVAVPGQPSVRGEELDGTAPRLVDRRIL